MRIFESVWLRHPRVWFTIGTIGWSCAFMMAMADRAPPTHIPNMSDLGVSVHAGTELRVYIPVVRDTERRCSVKTTRFIIDSQHTTRTVVPLEFTTAEGRMKREMESPATLRIVVPVPVETPSGTTLLQTENQYVCAFNPTTWIVPIDDSWTVRFTTLPAKSGVVIVN